MMDKSKNIPRVQKWTQEDLRSAIEAVRLKTMNKSTASRTFGIPYSTLVLKTGGWKGRNQTDSGGPGGPTTIPIEQEQDLASLLKIMNKWGFGLSKNMVLDVVEEYVSSHNIPNRFHNGRPGDEWFRNFCSRNRLSLKKPQLLESSRARQASDPFVVFEFYQQLTDLITKLGLADKPHLIFNCDESGYKSDAAGTKVVAGIGDDAQRESNGNGRMSTTVLTCVNAKGGKFPLFIIYKGKNRWNSMMGSEAEGAYPQTAYDVTEDGWMNRDTFTKWFRQQFLPSIKDAGGPVLLIYDGHLSHIGIELIEEAMKHQVTILKLPPHTSHILQPLDLTVFRGMKIRWDAILNDWSRHHRGQLLSKANFSNLMGKLWQTLDANVIMKGFKVSGIFDPALEFPVNFSAIPNSRFNPEKLLRFQSQHVQHTTSHLVDQSPIIMTPPPPIIIDTRPPQTIDCTLSPSATTMTALPVPGSMTPHGLVFQLNLQVRLIENNQLQIVSGNVVPPLPVSPVATPTQSTTTTPKPFAQLLLDTVTPAPTQPRRKRTLINTAEVITTDSYLELLKKQDEEKRQKKRDQEERKRKKVQTDKENVPKKRRGRPSKNKNI